MEFTTFKGPRNMTPIQHTPSRITASAVALVLLAACGGGGGDPPAAVSGAQGTSVAPAPATASAPSPAAPPASTAAPAPAPAPAGTATCGLSNFAASALARINQLRASGATCGARGTFAPTTALTWGAPLTQAAEGHSQDMSSANYFSHTSADGRTLADRVNATGYAWSTLGENIAAGYATVDSVMDGWTASDGHCANLMSPNFTEVGLACIPGAAGSGYNTYWTMDLGTPP